MTDGIHQLDGQPRIGDHLSSVRQQHEIIDRLTLLTVFPSSERYIDSMESHEAHVVWRGQE